MLKLSPLTWIRFGLWMTAGILLNFRDKITKLFSLLGFLMYGFYGFWHSSQRFINETQKLLSASSNNPPLIDSSET
jgi:hypothetical protein